MHSYPAPAEPTRPPPSSLNSPLRILVVAEHASLRFGGEASLPFYYFKLLRQRGHDVYMALHSRTRDELRRSLGDDFHRVHFVDDTPLDRFLYRIANNLPDKLAYQTIGILSRLITMLRLRQLVRSIVRRHGIQIVHETAPISPKQLSAMFSVGAPVVIGPMCGGMTYPPAFRYIQGRLSRTLEAIGRITSHIANHLIPGKTRADTLIVANPLTRRALPWGTRGQIYEVVESGVDLDIWGAPDDSKPARDPSDSKVRFTYLGRLVDWKGVDLLLEAFAKVARDNANAFLEIIGDGPLGPTLRERTAQLRLDASRIHFTGWMSRPDGAARLRYADVFVMPSLRECGGTAILEAMAMGLPIITTNWGGPSHYVDDSSGIRVNPASREEFISGLAASMLQLAADPDLRHRMSLAAKARVATTYFDWQSKTDRLLEIYRDTLDRTAPQRQPVAPASPSLETADLEEHLA